MVATTWTAADDEMLRAKWEEGLSAAKIGVLLNRSRNAVLGRAFRKNLPTHKKSTKSPDYVRQMNGAYRVRINKFGETIILAPAKRNRRSKRQTLVNTSIVPVLPQAPMEPIAFMDLQPHHCRAVMGSSDDYRGLATFCGQEKVKGESYCAYHCSLYFAPRRAA